MITPYDGKDVQPYYPTCIDIETSPKGDIIAIGFIWEDHNGSKTYTAYDNIGKWYDYYSGLILRYRSDKNILKRLTRIYAHNGANFDYLSFYEYFSEQREMIDAQYFTADSTGIGFQAKLRKLGKTIVFLDSYRMLPASLKKLGETFGIEAQKLEVPEECRNDYQLFKNTHPGLFWSYLENDVKGLQEILYSFWKQSYSLFGNVGHLPMTLPALTMRVFSKTLSEPIYTPSNKELKKLERDSYKGGLTLCLRTGIFENVNVYDVNSMYPAAMVANNYPVSYEGYWTADYEAQSMGVWRATFEQYRQDVPPILFDHKEGAAYRGSGVYSTNELNYLANIGGKFTIECGYVYTDTKPLFVDFIGGIYERRKEAQLKGDEALAFVLKIMMNSLYGKFAQRELGDKIVLGSPELSRKLIDSETPYKQMGNFFVIEEEREVKHCFVAIAAMITANARIDLHRRMRDVIDSGFDVYYCDTDSIHTNGVFETSNDLGSIKLEKQGTAAYAGRKIYAFESGKVTAKGIGRKITRGDLSFQAISKLAVNKDAILSLSFERFPSVKGVLSEKEKAAVMLQMTRNIRNTGGLWD